MRGLEPWMSLLEIQKKMPVELQGSWQDQQKKKGVGGGGGKEK